MTNAQSTNVPLLNAGVLSLTGLSALLVATGAPDVETLAQLRGFGLAEGLAVALLYVAPVLAILAALLLARVLGRGRSPIVRWVLYAVLGGVGGFILGLCLDLFVGVPRMIEGVTGVLSEPSLIDIALSSVAVLSILMGAMMVALAAFGKPAARALQMDETMSTADFEDIRRAERAVFGWSAFGMLTLGLSCAALAVARMAPVDGRLTPVLVALGAGIASAIASWVLWRGFDELQRRQVVNGYAVSAVLATLGLFVWAALEALAILPPIDASGVLVAIITVQLFATMFISASAASQHGLMGKPA